MDEVAQLVRERAPWGLIRDYVRGEPGPWRPADENSKRTMTRSQGYMSPDALIDKLRNCVCGGTGEHVRPPTKMDIRYGESRRYHEPCPECAPLRAALSGGGYEQVGDINFPREATGRDRMEGEDG